MSGGAANHTGSFVRQAHLMNLTTRLARRPQNDASRQGQAVSPSAASASGYGRSIATLTFFSIRGSFSR
jgi:hypothetical protein